MNLDNILKKLNLEDLSKYFKSSSIDKPVYSSKNNNLEIHFHLENPLPFQIYRILKDRLTKYLKCSISMTISTKNKTIEEKEIHEYKVEQLKFKRRHNKRDKEKIEVDEELRALEKLEKQEGTSKLNDN